MVRFTRATRAPVWLALSELWLDTELTEADYDRLSQVLAASPFSYEELRAIELWEVVPVVGANALSVTGEWAGFDPDWLYGECERHAQRRSLASRFAVALGLRQRFVRAFADEHWQQLKSRMEQLRA